MNVGLVGWVPDVLLFGLLPLLFWVAVIFLAVRFIKGRDPVPHQARSAGLAVLEERYARGEITRDEFIERRAVLQGEQR